MTATTLADDALPGPLWRNRDYVLLWSGQAVSIVGTNISMIAFPLFVLEFTGSPAVAGLVAGARSLPYLLLTLLAGALVDRWNRKATMFVCSAISAVAMASIVVATVSGWLSVQQIVLVSFIEGSCGVFFRLAETSALAQVVHRRQLPQAIAQQHLQYSVGAIVGPPLGGVLFSVSRLLPFAADACSYGASCLSLGAMRARLAVVGAAARRSLRAEISEGIVWLWHQPLIRYMAGLTGSINFVTSGGVLILIVLASQQGADPSTTGIILAASGAGGILGAVLAPAIQRRLSFGQAIIGVCWAYCVAWALFPLAATPLLLMVVGALATMISPAYNTVQMSYRLALIPNALQGRVNSAYRLVADGTKAIGAAVTGVMLEWFGASATLLLAAGLFAILAMVTTLNRHVREAPSLNPSPSL